MVNLSTTTSYRRSRQATVNWLTRASTAALTNLPEGTTSVVLDSVLSPDVDHPTWWVNPQEENLGPLFRRELTETQPRWLNAANRNGFFAGLKGWSWNRAGLGEVLPNHYFKVHYELDRENRNTYVRTVLDIFPGSEPAAVIHPQDEDTSRHHVDSSDRHSFGRGGRHSSSHRGGRHLAGRGRGRNSSDRDPDHRGGERHSADRNVNHRGGGRHSDDRNVNHRGGRHSADRGGGRRDRHPASNHADTHQTSSRQEENCHTQTECTTQIDMSTPVRLARISDTPLE